MTTINNSQLIEKVGGIEKAREIAFDPLHPQMTHVSNDGRHWVNETFAHIPEIQCQIESMIRIDDLRTAIAEHDSREFKVGDKIVMIKSYAYDDVREIKELCDSGKVCITTDSRKLRLSLSSGYMVHRHATPSEIKAGHRLEAERHG
ncbi:hypothetical protein [Acinetobacter guillouiae]|uniref:hypothetical protein n=1 Tax=Acinetobacter guillouiae TaxID=106649 RepID=UPI0026E16F49|nr:hypothetical protein [Acinetobacter guillouiae]MDO6646329.1 hypothetical protein [Acinetobacter guillouiae]